jgi:peptidoglycan/LPS O-acetylase OafA/YrhL
MVNEGVRKVVRPSTDSSHGSEVLRTLSPRAMTPPRMGKIDLFRGIAILAVILYHINGSIIFPGGWGLVRASNGVARFVDGSRALRLVFLPFHFGRVGVNLFFVISGLCIHMRYAFAQAGASRPPPFSAKVFFGRRFFRIYPVYWVALALGVVVGPIVYSIAVSPNGRPGAVHFPSVGNVAAHLVMLHSFFRAYMMDILPPLWSIATEEQFYILYPLVFVLIGRRLSVPSLVLILLGVTAVWRAGFVLFNPAPMTFSDGPFLVWVFGFSVARYYEWSLGALLAWAMANKRSLAMFPVGPIRFLGARPRLVMLLGVTLIAAGATSLLNVRVKWMVEDPCYSTGWFLILAATLLPRYPQPGSLDTGQDHAFSIPFLSIAGAWASKRLQNLGRRSYSVYLLHELVLFGTVALMHRFDLPRVAVAAPLGGLMIWMFCYPFYRYVEAPCENRSKEVGRSRAASPADRVSRVPSGALVAGRQRPLFPSARNDQSDRPSGT